MKRRRYLAGMLLFSGWASGCLRQKSAGLDDIRVRNETGEPQTVTVRVTRSATDEVLLAETRIVPTGQTGDERSIAFPDPIKSAGIHRIRVTVEDRESETYEWDV